MTTRAPAGAAVLAIVLGASGCPSPAKPSTAPSPAHDATPTDGSEDAASCGPEGERLDDYGWLPSSVQTVASIDLSSDEIDAALQRVSEHARGSGHGMPIDLAFALGQWSWQVTLVASTLASAGFRPGELVYVRMADATPVWLWASTCDLEQARTAVTRAWPVRLRSSVSAVIGTPVPGANPTDSDEPGNNTFAFDVVFLEGDRAALVPAGRGGSFVQSLVDDRLDDTQLELGLGPQLAEMPPAPIRLVWAGRALLEPGSAPRDAPRLGILAASAQRVDDATVPPP